MMKWGHWVKRIILSTFLFVSASGWAEVRFVNSRADAGTGTLREAITRANSGDEIRFNVEGEIHLSSKILIDKNLSVEGPGAQMLSVEGDLITQLFDIDGHNLRVSFSDLTLRGGNSNTFMRRGGAIFLHGILNQLTVNRVVFAGNFASWGGAIASDTTGAVGEFPLEVDIHDSTFRGNQAEDNGGAIYAKKTLLKITGTTLYENMALGGGGIYLVNSQLGILNSTLHRNHARSSGGAINWNVGGYFIDMAFVSITENSARFGGGGMTGGSRTRIRLINSVIADNLSAEEPENPDLFFEEVDSLGSNLIGVRGITRGWQSSDRLGTELFPLHPRLGSLKDNGGETFTLFPDEDSPVQGLAEQCIDWNGNPVTVDQRGVAREGGFCDAGAVERR